MADNHKAPEHKVEDLLVTKAEKDRYVVRRVGKLIDYH